MQYILTPEEYEELKKRADHIVKFREMLKEWRRRCEKVYQRHRFNIVESDYANHLQPLLKELGKTTDDLVKEWMPKEEV